ncbi:hypothetical protein QFC21_002083 [Naganishia friedmannii]|uniref:Uncharacterized protein n=1 Tax=Naganishia friedmannii TaxID=89922 RepID=A0ACC2VZR8_9TREE|nr:hypothetical protein QFC21_002083 [Naganishia friedmannii]
MNRTGYAYLPSDKTYIRLSDVIFEWCKPLPPWHVNAIKSLVNAAALLSPAHPLQVAPKNGQASGLAVFAGVLPGGKTRLYMSMRQIEYLRYYIAALGLIDPTKDEVDKWRKRCKEEGVETPCHEEVGLERLKRLPLPDSRWWVREEDLVDVVSVTIATEDDFKRAMKNAASLYRKRKSLNDIHAVDATLSAANKEQPISAIGPTENMTPPAFLSQQPELTIKRAQSSYPLSNAYTASSRTNPGAWLSIDFQVWEPEYGVVLDVGWASKWFVPSEDGEWIEKTDGGHWIVQEHEQKLNANMIIPAAEDGRVARGHARIPYMYGGKSEVLPLDVIKEQVRALIPLMRKRGTGGPVHLVVHSADRHIASMTLLGLEIVPLRDEPGCASVRQQEQVEHANAQAESRAGTLGKLVVFDTSVLLAAIADDNTVTAYPPVSPVQTSTWTQGRLAQALVRGGVLRAEKGGDHRVDGNSGNHAAVSVVRHDRAGILGENLFLISHIPSGICVEKVKLECFTTSTLFFLRARSWKGADAASQNTVMVTGIERLRPVLAESAPSFTTTSQATVSAAAADIVTPARTRSRDWSLDIRALADMQHQTLTAAVIEMGPYKGKNADNDDGGSRMFTAPTANEDHDAREWDYKTAAAVAASSHIANPHIQLNTGPAGQIQEGDDEEVMDNYTLQKLIDDLGDMDPQVGRFGPDWEGDASDDY